MNEVRLTGREFDILVNAAKWYKLYDKSNPDVGMGMSDLSCVRKVCDQLPFYVCPADIELVTYALSRIS